MMAKSLATSDLVLTNFNPAPPGVPKEYSAASTGNIVCVSQQLSRTAPALFIALLLHSYLH